jgi:hypothetical protein
VGLSRLGHQLAAVPVADRIRHEHEEGNRAVAKSNLQALRNSGLWGCKPGK